MTLESADPTPEPTVTEPAAGTAGNQPDYKSLYEQMQKDAQAWKQRFTGLQGKYQQEQARWADDASHLVDVQSQLDELSGIREQLEVTVSTLNEQLDTARTEGVVAQEELERVRLVTTEFPQLVPFLQDDLLPDGAGDELREKLKTMSTRIDSIKESRVAEHVEGASPSSKPAASPIDSAQSLLQQASAAMREGKLDDYQSLYDQYLKTSAQGGQ